MDKVYILWGKTIDEGDIFYGVYATKPTPEQIFAIVEVGYHKDTDRNYIKERIANGEYFVSEEEITRL